MGVPTPRAVQRTYLLLTLGNTLAASFIWGINTIFLLDAGLSNLEAFAANAFFTAGMVLFEVPTGIVADTVGRRASYLLGTMTLTVTTLLYVLLWEIQAPFWRGRSRRCARPRVHVLLGRGRGVAGRRAQRDRVHRRARDGLRARADRRRCGDAHRLARRRRSSPSRSASGCRSSCAAAVLAVMFVVAFRLMHDIGFTPQKGGPPAGRDAQDRGRVDRVRLARARGQVADGPGAVHRRHRDLRLLRAAAVPARALRRPARVRDRRAVGGDRGRRPDPRRPRAPHIRAALRAPDLGAAR